MKNVRYGNIAMLTSLLLGVLGVTARAAPADPCSGVYTTQATCDAVANCAWCKSAAVPSSCNTLTNAKALPPAVFACDKVLDSDEWYTPPSTSTAPQQWTIVNESNVNGHDYQNPHCHETPQKMATHEDCQAACASTATCNSYTWTPGVNVGKKSCRFTHQCWWRDDTVWKPQVTPECAGISGFKDGRIPTLPPTRPPTPLPPLPPAKSPLSFQPNIVFLLTDDQDRKLGAKGYTELGSLEAMPMTQQLLMNEGVFMDHFYVNTPICCPSRTEFFSGRYYHTVGPPAVTDGSCMHVDTGFAARNDTGLFGLMTRAGYNTGVFGKVTNDQSKILPEAISHNSMRYVDSPLNYNNYDGTTYWRYWMDNHTQFTETLDKTNPIFGTTYQTTQIGNRTLRWLNDEAIPKAKAATDPMPFFLYIGPHAPHFPAEPAPWYVRESPPHFLLLLSISIRIVHSVVHQTCFLLHFIIRTRLVLPPSLPPSLPLLSGTNGTTPTKRSSPHHALRTTTSRTPTKLSTAARTPHLPTR